MEKPKNLKDEHLEFLDGLRESGITNMYGSGSYLREEFSDIDDCESHEIVRYWMETFSDRQKIVSVNLGDVMDKIKEKND